MKQRLCAIASALFLLVTFVPAVSAADDANAPVNLPVARPLSPRYAAVKAALDAQAPQSVSAVAPQLGAVPTTLLKFKGQAQNNVSPSDATGAVSPTSYIELVNEKIGVYNRSGTLTSSSSEGTFTGFGSAAHGDGVILYDVHDQRFYFAMLYISGSSNELGFGFSKTGTPTASASDWCTYHSTFGVYGTAFPDYPKIGQTSDFVLIGVNRFSNGSSSGVYVGSDVVWTTKPAAGTITTCPAQTLLRTGVQQTLLNADSSLASTPVPGRETDDTSTGYVVANYDVSAGGSASALSVFSVTKNTKTGTAIFGSATTVNVATYSMPPSAPQKGTSFKLDTLDGRLTNAWLSPDPNQGGAVALWTQQTVAASAGGLGAEDRWYEIDPMTGNLFQRGIAQSPTLYVFMGAIAPDRNGATGQFGGNMVMDFNTSSSTQLAATRMISKIGANPQSGFVLVINSTKADKDFTCSTTTPCRWGDYSGASPDPAATTNGQVWVSIMLSNGGNSFTAGWTTENFEAKP
jgi:hypothetical protein